MSANRVVKPSSTHRRRVLSARVFELGAASSMPCSPCSAAHLLCVFSAQSPKCSECIRRGIRCDGNFSAAEFDRLREEESRLQKARRAALEEALSLDRRIESLRKAQHAMLAREAQSLALEDEEVNPAAPSSEQQSNVASVPSLDEQLAAFFGSPLVLPGSAGDNPQGSQN